VKREQSDDAVFVEYDDNNMEHVMAGPDYGQPESGSKETAWSELSSREYPEYVSAVRRKILKGTFFKLLSN